MHSVSQIVLKKAFLLVSQPPKHSLEKIFFLITLWSFAFT